MLDAFHKNTETPYHNYEVSKIFEAPGKEEWVCCPICMKPVSYVKEHKRKVNGKNVPVIMHWRIKNADSGGCISGGESDEHRNSKILLANLLENKEIKIQYEGLDFSFDDLKIKDVPQLPFRWEQKRENRRADILFEFIEWHPVLGKGINFEIQKYSQTDENKFERENDWVKQGYSITWIPIESFDGYSFLQDKIGVDVIWMHRLFQIKYNELSEIIVSFENQFKREFDSFLHLYEQKINKTETHFNIYIDKKFNKKLFELEEKAKDHLSKIKFNILYPESVRVCQNCKYFQVNRRLRNSYWCSHSKSGTLPESSCCFWEPKERSDIK